MASNGATGSAVGSSNAPSSANKGSKTSKNAPGSKNDNGWKYGIPIEEDARKIRCKFCEKTFSGGIYRLKHHLAGTKKDVGACRAVPAEVKKEMREIVVGLQEKLVKKTIPNMEEKKEDIGDLKRKREDRSSTGLFKRSGASTTQSTINSIYKKGLHEEACNDIASFIYNNALPFNVVKSEEFHKMCESISRHGLGFKPPSYHDIRVKYLKQQYQQTMENISEHRAHWKKMGCTIMTDGWTDKRRRTLINFLVNNSMGTIFLKSVDASNISKTTENVFKMIDEVVDEVGEENVVQVVTDNAANYKAAGEMLMLKRKRLYWTPCAAHCIDLMLEDFEKKIQVHHDTIPKAKRITTYIYSRTSLISILKTFTKDRELVRPAMTRFATSYLTLGCLNENKLALIRMFNSDEWKASRSACSSEGKLIEEVVMDKDFWKNIVIC
ncbi:hypothetical protein KSP39_PZI018649 [Platanthera zijinensis]|uniref:BED-type domain-containing protein n=1 Tax=Platanthera zijinensis TaxID=2320716 RepID=A0AAP0B3E0_9ASPA